MSFEAEDRFFNIIWFNFVLRSFKMPDNISTILRSKEQKTRKSNSSEISPTRCNNCVFFLRNGFTCFGRQSHPSSGVHMLYMATGKPAYLGCKFSLDVSVVNSPIVVELLVITALFCVVLPAGNTTQNYREGSAGREKI